MQRREPYMTKGRLSNMLPCR